MMEYQQPYSQQPYTRHPPAVNTRDIQSVSTASSFYPIQHGYYPSNSADMSPSLQQQLPPAHILQYFSPPLLHHPSPISSYPSSAASTTSRHSAQSYSPSPYAFTPPRLTHQQSSSASHHYATPSPPRANGRAVIIGINYFTQKGELSPSTSPSSRSPTGPNPCRDARNLYTYLIQVKQYAPDKIILLTDDQNGTFGQPTRKNIMKALDWIGENAGTSTNNNTETHRRSNGTKKEQEKVVIYYSGHGRVSTQGRRKSSSKRSSPTETRHSPTTSKQQHQSESNEDEEGGNGLETVYPVDFRSFPRGMITPEEMDEKLQPAKRRGVKMTVIFDTYTGVRG